MVTALTVDPVTQYANDVCQGNVPACRFVIQACERHLYDLGRDDLVWNLNEAMIAIDFFPLLRHYKGPFAGEQFHLSPWEKFIVGSIFGWYGKDGLRRFRESLIEIPRKNGKSTLAGGIALLLFLFDGESGAEVYTVATKEEQAKIVWDSSRVMVNRSPSLSKRVKVLHNTMKFERAESIFRPLGRDSKTQDGLNPSGAVGDEPHAWPNGEMYDVISSGMGGRDQPLIVLISTAGTSRACWYFTHRKHGVNVLDGYTGDYQDDRIFVFIATIDKDDDPFDEKAWYKANPELGEGKRLQYMRDQAARAKQLPSALNNFLTKQLNVWIESSSVWMPLDRWDKCAGEVDIESLKGQPCWGGLDLASNTDFNALVWVFDIDDRYIVLPRLWIPEETLNDNRKLRDKRVLDVFRRWVREGHIMLTPGDWIDYSIIEQQIRDDAEMFDVQDIGYDPYNAGNLPVRLDEDGITVTSIGQGFKWMSPAAKEFEKRILSAGIQHSGTPVLRWMLGNLVMRSDPNGNIRPDKEKAPEKIDGIVAMIMAIHRAMDREQGTSVYEERGVIEC